MTAPGWYPDRTIPNAERYWDGRSWTANTRPSTRVQQPVSAVPPAPTKRNLVVWLSIAVAVVAVLLITGIVALLSSNDSSPTSTTKGQNVLTGDSDQWRSRVCAPGKYMDGGVSLPDAVTVGICLSRSDNSPTIVASFGSELAADNAAAQRTQQGGSYAIGTDSNGVIWLFVSSWQDKGSTLAPLRDFGFTLH